MHTLEKLTDDEITDTVFHPSKKEISVQNADVTS
jgi:hypothetical protein